MPTELSTNGQDHFVGRFEIHKTEFRSRLGSRERRRIRGNCDSKANPPESRRRSTPQGLLIRGCKECWLHWERIEGTQPSGHAPATWVRPPKSKLYRCRCFLARK